jgi:hypothetical protein
MIAPAPPRPRYGATASGGLRHSDPRRVSALRHARHCSHAERSPVDLAILGKKISDNPSHQRLLSYSKGVDDILAHYQKLQAEDRACEEAIKAAEVAVDYHTVENRNKRKAFQKCRNTVAQQMKLISENAQRGQQSL